MNGWLYPQECPSALVRWANNSLVGRRLQSGRLRIAGWRWDGVSDEVRCLLAPSGERYYRIPPGVWERMQEELRAV